MKKLIFILFIIFTSCSQNDTYKFNKKTKVSKNTEELILDLLEYGGMRYSESNENKNFMRFKNETSNEELIKLTDYRNPTIRCYAFKALVEKNYSGIIKIFYKHLYDDANLKDGNPGCIRRTQLVKNYMLTQLHPISNYKYKLDSTEYKRIEDMFWDERH